jgi:CHAT domain/Effector-associated domain 9
MNLFELYLTPLDAKGLRVTVTQSSPPSDGVADSTLPFWQDEQDWRSTLIKTLGSDRFQADAFRRVGEQDWMVNGAEILAQDRSGFHPNYLKHVGKALYEALFPSGPVRQAFQTALRLAETEDTELHIRLKFPANSAARSRLADYPWELLHDGQRFLQHRQVYVSRYIADESVPPRLAPAQKLRVAVVSSRATDAAQNLGQLPDLEPQALRRGIAKAEQDGLIELAQVPQPTFKGLSRYLTDCDSVPQVLHFDGHGLFGKKCRSCQQIHGSLRVAACQKCGQQLPDPQGFLVFEDEGGKPDYVSATALAAAVQGIAVVVLSACESGMAIAGESVFNGAAQQLIDARVPAVVAMQYAVNIQAASDFVEQFYRVLGKQRSLLAAVNEGRKWMGVDGNQWYRPVLYLRWQDNEGGQLFDQVKIVDEAKVFDQVKPVDSPKAWLSMVQQLKIDRLQTELEDLQEDYKTVSQQLRLELDGDTQNKLKRKLEHLEQQMTDRQQLLDQARR